MSDILPSSVAGSLEPELRLVLLGSIGCGKTLTGDTLLGVPSSPFASGPSPRLCHLRRGTSAGRRLTVVEAPRWYWSGGHMDTDVRKETERAFDLCDPGPHAFLLLVPIGQFTEVERRVPSELEVVFGEGVLDHTLVVLTCGDYLMGKEAGRYLEGEDPGLREVINRCGGRYHVINNRQSQDRNQVRELLEKVENIVEKRRGCYMKQNTLQRENEALAREREEEREKEEREREERARQNEREKQARQKETEEQARQKEREERARQKEREEQARQKEREEQARQKEREERARQKEREEQAKEREKELREVKVQAGERVMEGRASERERELRQKQAEVEEEKRATVLESSHATVTQTRRYWGSRSTVLPKSPLERRVEEVQGMEDYRLQVEEKEKREEMMRRKEREGMEDRREGTENGKELMEERVTAKPAVKNLYSAPVPQPQPSEPRNGGPTVFTRTPSFNLTKEGAVLSQMSEDRTEPTKKVVNTIYHRINSSEMMTPSSPRSSPSSPLVHTDASPSSPLFSPAPSSPPPSSSEMRVVMLGRSGSGKSAVGNVLLGREEFVSLPDRPTPITQDCQKGRAIVAGRHVAVVDTPDWSHSDHPPERVRSQLSSCVALAAPGPHAFLFCVPVDQPAREELKALNVLEKVFGPGAVRTHTLVLFTHADRLRRSGKASDGGVDEVERYISSQRRDLLELVERCGDRYHVMEGGARVGGGAEEERRSVEQLLEKVERTVREGGGGWYSCILFQEAEDRVRQRQTEIARERRGGQGLRSPSMQPVTETEEEEVKQEEIERTREEAERSVSVMELEGLPSFSSPPSFMTSIWDAVGGAGGKVLSAFPRPVWGNKTGAGAINVENLPSLPSSAQSPSSLPSSARSPSSLPSSAQPPSFLRSVWEKVGAGASRIPKSTAGGAFLGAVLGVFLGGPVGGAIGATVGSVMTEVGRWRSSTKKNSPEETDLIAGLEGQMDEPLETE
uniref:AIG1-type G domain-containing protein n=1 Tax=Esox lucius TaxID=8010 RepID=A0AAY5KVI3_ESOLU